MVKKIGYDTFDKMSCCYISKDSVLALQVQCIRPLYYFNFNFCFGRTSYDVIFLNAWVSSIFLHQQY